MLKVCPHDFIIVKPSEYCEERVIAQIAGIAQGVIHAIGEYPFNDIHIPYDINYFFKTSKKPHDDWEDVPLDPEYIPEPVVIPERPSKVATKTKKARNSKFKIALKLVKENPDMSRMDIRQLMKQKIPGGATDNMCNTYFYKAKKALENNKNDSNQHDGAT